jgi:hypothetical protein
MMPIGRGAEYDGNLQSMLTLLTWVGPVARKVARPHQHDGPLEPRAASTPARQEPAEPMLPNWVISAARSGRHREFRAGE